MRQKILRTIKTFKRRSYKLFNKLFIHLPVDLIITANKYLKSGKVSKSEYKIKSKGKLLLIRHDGIGDYILFRNFIETLRNSAKFKGYKITLLGNAAWKELAEFLDKDFIDEFIWIDKRKFVTDFFYRYKKFKEIAGNEYEILIHPFSREFFNADNDLAFFIKADKKIGSIRSALYLKSYRRKILEKIYSNLIPDAKGVWFEFYKNKNFFEKILSKKIDLKKPFIKLNPPENPELKSRLNLPHPYAALFIGASVKHRKWPAKNFAEVARHLQAKYSYDIVLCGGKNELGDVTEFKDYLKTKKDFDNSINFTYNSNNISFIDTVGKISLVDLLYVVKNASLVISNETMAPHIAMALSNETANINSTNSNTLTVVSKPVVIVISTGEASYEHFVPYPEKIGGNYIAVFHPYIEKNLKEYIDITTTFGRGYDDKFDVSEITVKSVLNKIIMFL